MFSTIPPGEGAGREGETETRERGRDEEERQGLPVVGIDTRRSTLSEYEAMGRVLTLD